MEPRRGASAWVWTVLLAAGLLAAPSAADAARSSGRPGSHDAVRLTIHGRGSNVTVGGYRTSLGTGGPASAPASTPTAAASTPSSVQGFLGIPQIEGFEPADTTGAMGRSFFLTAVNTRYAVWNLDGSQAVAPTLLDTVTTDDDALDLFDPKVVYDPYRDTFVLVYLAQRDSPRGSLIVISAIPDATADDASTWCTTTIQGDQISTDQPTWADYPGVGFNRDRLVVTTNEFTFPTSSARFAYAQVLSLKKTSLYDCTAPAVIGDVFAGTQTRNTDGTKAFSIQPAQTVGTAARDQFLLSFQGPGRGSFLELWRLRRTATGITMKETPLRAGLVAGNIVGTQAGGSLTDPDTFWDPGDQRLINAWYDADRGRLYAAHNVAKDLLPDTVTGDYLESVVRWYEVAPAGTLSHSTITRRGIVGAPETDAGWPAVATDAAGNLFITFSRGSEPLGEFISAWAAEIPPGSTIPTLTELVPGTALHDSISGVERWGDYNAAGRDPLDATRVVMVNQIATPGSAWQQTVNLVSHT